MKPKPLVIAVLYALAYQRIGMECVRLKPAFNVRRGLFLANPGSA